MFVLDSYCILLKNTYSIMRVKDSTMQSFLVISVKKNLEDVLISYHIIYRVRGTKLSFLLLVRFADPADRKCDRPTDGRMDGRPDRHNKQALGLLVSNTLK